MAGINSLICTVSVEQPVGQTIVLSPHAQDENKVIIENCETFGILGRHWTVFRITGQYIL